MPDVVIQVEQAKQVGTVLKIANLYGISARPLVVLVPLLTGGATPVQGGWVLDLSKLSNFAIDEKSTCPV